MLTTILEYLREQQSGNELKNFSQDENIYYHGTSNEISNDFITYNKEKNFDEFNTNWSKQIQGIGKFYSSSIENAYSFIDFRNSDTGKIIQIYFKPNKPYDVKNITKFMSILDKFGLENNVNSIPVRNKMFVQQLIKSNYDSIVFKEGPSYNPNSSKYKADVIIPLITNKIKIEKTYTAKSRNGGIFEGVDPHYSRWKRNNVTYRGITDSIDTLDTENGNGAMLGVGLYSVPASNKSMARGYGKLYILLNAKPSNPKVFKSLNEWEIWCHYTLYTNYFKGREDVDKYRYNSTFHQETTIEDEMQKLGYDGIIIKGREMVNFKPKNVMYFQNENQLMNYYYDFVEGKQPGTGGDVEL